MVERALAYYYNDTCINYDAKEQKMKHGRRKALLCAVAFVICILAIVIYSNKETPEDVRPVLSESICVKKEFIECKEPKLVSNNILGAYFDNLDISKSDNAFSGNWVYRFTFFCNEVYPKHEEIVVLVGERSIAYNGINYEFPPEVDYGEFLNVLKAMYKRSE